MKRLYHETFTQDGKPNPAIWTLEVGEKWANNESQCYVDDLDHAFVKDGVLTIRSTIHHNEHCKYRSARLNSKGKLEFLYGKLTIRAKMPKGKGAWPALWLMGNTAQNKVRWPLCGEIDLVEFAGNRPGIITCAIHTDTYNHTKQNDKGKKIKVLDASTAFHDYTLDWTKDYLSFQIDGKEFYRVEKQPGDTVKEWPFDTPYYVIMNVAVGGWYAGPITDQDLPWEMQIASITIDQIE
jgi:beta-glucanase (GH16 family)